MSNMNQIPNTAYSHEMEKPMYEVTYLGIIADFGLGVNNGITSPLNSESEVKALATQNLACLVPKSDDVRVACIDGRATLGFYDDSEYAPLERASGASLADYVMQTVSSAEGPHSLINDTMCSHDCVCGAANGAIDHLLTAALNNVQATTKQLMNNDVVSAFFKTKFDTMLADQTIIGFNDLESEFELAGWDGMEYTKRAIELNPAGVEKLDGEDSKPHHGHQEQYIELILDEDVVSDQRKMEELGLPDKFSVNLGRIKRIANELSGGDEELRTRLIITGLAWNLAVTSNLCDENMPIVLVTKKSAELV